MVNMSEVLISVFKGMQVGDMCSNSITVVKADRTFYFQIVDEKTKVVLFAGTVCKPETVVQKNFLCRHADYDEEYDVDINEYEPGPEPSTPTSTEEPTPSPVPMTTTESSIDPETPGGNYMNLCPACVCVHSVNVAS